jgi:5'-3' exonuclease
MQALTMLGVRQITDPNAEADDLAGYLSRNLSGVKLITGDMDWLQLVSKSTSWHCYKSKRDCCHSNFEEFTGFKTPKLFLEGKCLVGDNSDSIPGVGGIGKDTVAGFLDTWGSVQGFYDAVDADKSIKLSKVHQTFADNLAPTKVSKKYGQLIPMRDAYARNVQLMDLSLYSPKKSSLVIDNGQLDLNQFKEFCQDHSFRTILATLETWATPFKNLKG